MTTSTPLTFANSWQAKQFLFTPEQLAQKRHSAYEKTRAEFAVSLAEADHLRYVNYYCDKLLENSRKIMFNRYQRYTALALMQRVYLARTVWEIPPPLAMIACLFLVSKFIKPETLDSLLAALGYGNDFYEKFRPREQVAHFEIEVLAALDYKLRVYLPFHQVIAICAGQPFEPECEACQQALFDMLRTDVLLLFPPGQIAVAAVAKIVGIEAAVQAASGAAAPADLRTIVEEILAMQMPNMRPDEVERTERRIGEEMAVFQTMRQEKMRESGSVGATSMFPP